MSIQNLLLWTFVLASCCLINLTSARSTSTRNLPDCKKYPTGTFLPNPGDRTSFFVCINKRPKLLSCPTDFCYDTTSSLCLPYCPGDGDQDSRTTQLPCTTSSPPCDRPTPTPCSTPSTPCSPTPCSTPSTPCSPTPCSTTPCSTPSTPCSTTSSSTTPRSTSSTPRSTTSSSTTPRSTSSTPCSTTPCSTTPCSTPSTPCNTPTQRPCSTPSTPCTHRPPCSTVKTPCPSSSSSSSTDSLWNNPVPYMTSRADMRRNAAENDIYADPRNCSKYYIFHNGRIQNKHCSRRECFNRYTRKCQTQ